MGTKKQDAEILKRVEDEARGGGQVMRNSNMVCKNCEYAYDDSESLVNATVCEIYTDQKPARIIFNHGNCIYYSDIDTPRKR